MSHNQQAHREKARAAFSSVLWSLFLTGIKVWAGVATNSLGILSEALHSGLDFCAAAMTLYAVKVSAIPPDKSHPYGHEKVENLSALIETALLVLTCFWIGWEAFKRLFFEAPDINLTWWAFAVVAISLVVDVNRSAMLRRVAKKHNSQALEADALHFTTDIWSSAVVLAGLVCVWLSGYARPDGLLQSILHKADAVAALVVAAIILRVSWKLSRRAIHALMDGASVEMTDAVRQALATGVPLYPVLALRLRNSGATTFVEVTLGMPSHLHVDDAHALTERVEAIIRDVVPCADTVVHVEPDDFVETHSDNDLAVHIALKHDLLVHAFNMFDTPRGKLLTIDIELPEDRTLGDTAPVVAAFEEELRQALDLYKLIVKIEPLCRNSEPVPQDFPHDCAIPLIEDAVHKIITLHPEITRLCSLDTDDIDATHSIIIHAAVPAQKCILDCHEIACSVEHDLHHELPWLARIMVVIEPDTPPAGSPGQGSLSFTTEEGAGKEHI